MESTPLLPKLNRLTLGTLVSFGLGTVLNDMVATVWFTYSLYVLQAVKGVSPTGCATVLLVGQISDATFTPLCGYLCDSTRTRFGRRRPWLLLGCVIESIAVYALFAQRFVPRSTDVLYNSLLGSALNFGYASIQVAHLSLVPELSSSDQEVVLMNSVKFGFTNASSLMVFIIAAAVFHLVSDVGTQFTIITLVTVVVGGICMIACISGVPEGSDMAPLLRKVSRTFLSWHEWLTMPSFWAVGLVFCASRIVLVLLQVTLPFFLVRRLSLPQESIAWAPFVMQTSSLLTTSVLKRVHRHTGIGGQYILGCVICLSGCYFAYCLRIASAQLVYACVVLLGAGTSLLMVSVMTMEARVVGDRVDSGAFVYGAIGSTEKISTGIIIFLLEHFDRLQSPSFVGYVFTILPTLALLLASIFAILLSRQMAIHEPQSPSSPATKLVL
mmetsp:Transcript_16474/g.27221  ORF Transcript_16474/g.27221 Transcript_16474/m.27221 type:complete len:441 (-) Transcript_16474:1427-2749(-)